MEIDLRRQLATSGNQSYCTDTIIKPTEQIELSGPDVTMAAGHEKSYAKTRKDS